jgi:hypothetical protein
MVPQNKWAQVLQGNKFETKHAELLQACFRRDFGPICFKEPCFGPVFLEQPHFQGKLETIHLKKLCFWAHIPLTTTIPWETCAHFPQGTKETCLFEEFNVFPKGKMPW